MKEGNKSVGYSLFLLHSLGSILAGVMGLTFVVLALYLLYHDLAAGLSFQVKFLMMPMMNILISSMLLFYCRNLFLKASRIKKSIAAGTFQAPQLKITSYDIMAMTAFAAFVALASYFIIQ